MKLVVILLKKHLWIPLPERIFSKTDAFSERLQQLLIRVTTRFEWLLLAIKFAFPLTSI